MILRKYIKEDSAIICSKKNKCIQASNYKMGK